MQRTRVLAATALALAAVIAFAPAGAGADDPFDNAIPLGTFTSGTTIHAPYECDDDANAAAGAWGRESEAGPRADVDLPVNGSDFAFQVIAEANTNYVALVICGTSGNQDITRLRAGRLTEGIEDISDTTNFFVYTFNIVDDPCGTPATAPGTTPDTTPDTTPVTTPATTPATTPDTTPDTTIEPPGPSRLPHQAGCVGSGGGSLPATGTTSTPILPILGGLAVLGGGALLWLRRRPLV